MAKTIVLIPTCNRSDLVQRSIRSALRQTSPALLKIVVSDNSSEPEEAEAVRGAVQSISDARLEYIRPEAPLNMGDHWEWAIWHVIERFSPTHLMLLTDRMVFRGQAVEEMSCVADRHPDRVISSMHDRINDFTSPVILDRKIYSATVVRVEASRLLELSARSVFHQSLPLLMNSITPVNVFRRVKAAFGTCCRAVSPDYGFAYRYLATHPDLLFYDKAFTIHAGQARSNGASAARGVLSKDAVRFRAESRLVHAPYPEIFTLGNSMMEEYCRSKNTPQASWFPPVEPRRYLKMLCSDALAMDDHATRDRFLGLLRQRGHRITVFWQRLRRWTKTHTKWIEQEAKKAIGSAKARPEARMAFPSTDAALVHDQNHPVAPVQTARHLSPLNPQPVN